MSHEDDFIELVGGLEAVLDRHEPDLALLLAALEHLKLRSHRRICGQLHLEGDNPE